MEPLSALSDPGGASSLVAAGNWIEQTLLGTVATTVAVLAVAAVGLLMLSGRVHSRRGATVVLGCFILFGAPAIAAGLRELTLASASQAVGLPSAQLADVPPVIQPAPPPPDYDPYAGASVRRR